MISDTYLLCYWPVVKVSIVLLVSILWIIQRLGRKAVGVGVGREVCREKDMVVVRERDSCSLPDLTIEAIIVLILLQ